MRTRFITAVAGALVAVTATMAAVTYVNADRHPAKAATISSERGSWMSTQTPLPLLSRPAPAKVETESPKPEAKPKAATRSAKPKAAKPEARKATAKPASRKSTSKQAEAERILRGLIRKYPILKGTTVSFGQTRSGAQAEAYYKSGRIVVSPNHTRSLSVILTHEAWHIIDWRDNGRIDWGERIPPLYSVR